MFLRRPLGGEGEILRLLEQVAQLTRRLPLTLGRVFPVVTFPLELFPLRRLNRLANNVSVALWGILEALRAMNVGGPTEGSPRRWR